MVNDMKCILQARYITSNTEIENLIRQTWGHDYSVTLATAHKGTLEYHVTGEFATEALRQRAAAIQAGKRDRHVGLILNVLCHMGLIPAGTYVIREDLPQSTSKKWDAGQMRIAGIAC
jgi:hypothetical protein